MIISKVTKNKGFTLSIEDTFFEKPHGGQTDPPPHSRFRVNGSIFISKDIALRKQIQLIL